MGYVWGSLGLAFGEDTMSSPKSSPQPRFIKKPQNAYLIIEL
jgi:hypothetical protein